MRRFLAVLSSAAVVAAAVLATAGQSSADAGDGTPCVHGSWPADVQGRPATLQPFAAEGLYVWHTNDGWRLAVTHPDTSHVRFTGTIKTDGRLYGVERRTERSDHVVFAEDAGGVRYRFENYGHLDGIAFHTRCANRLTFDGQVDGKPLRSDQVFIGSDGHHPGGVPFVIARQG
jgi:hypothetical protein